MTRLCLIRHGQTDWNLEGRYQGQTDVPLNATGLAQALELVEELKDQPFAAVYASNLQRAMETANILAEPFHLPVTIEPRLVEISQGEWEGKLFTDIKQRYPWLSEKLASDAENLRPPGGETVGEVSQRVYAALDDLAQLYPNQKVLVVSHGIVMATVVCKVNGIPLGHAYQVLPENSQPIWVEWGS